MTDHPPNRDLLEMLEEQGVVTDVQGRDCWVDVNVRSGCDRCSHSCPGASIGRPQNPIRLKLPQPPGWHLSRGDRVMLGVPENCLVSAAARVYLWPLLSLLGGAVTGSWLARLQALISGDGAALLGALLGLGLYFLYAKWTAAAQGSAVMPVILRRC